MTKMIQAPNVHDAEPIPEAARAEIDRLLQSGDLFRYTAPQDAPVSLLEAEFAEFMGVKYALAVSSCSAALFLSLKALGLPRDAKVLIPSFTFAAVPSSVVHAECRPVLCEVGDDYRVNLRDFEAKLDEVKAVIISHMRGHTSDMDAIMAMCNARSIPVVEDAAHSLGTRWNGQKIGTMGKIGCFSFQSYKLVNAGEGGVMITNDPEIVAKAIIMSGAYEHNWNKHPVLMDVFPAIQNTLPLYNLRMSNLSAAVIRPQLAHVEQRVLDGRRNHDQVAARLNQSPWITVPDKLPAEERAPDSIQFNLDGMTEDERREFARLSEAEGVKVQIFGLSSDNARAFWNWQFVPDLPADLPATRAMLMRACDVRLPARLTGQECEFIADVLVRAAENAKQPERAYGT